MEIVMEDYTHFWYPFALLLVAGLIIINNYINTKEYSKKVLKFMYEDIVIFTVDIKKISILKTMTTIFYENKIILNSSLYEELKKKDYFVDDRYMKIDYIPERNLPPYKIIID